MAQSGIRLSAPERQELESRARSRVLRAGDVRRARLILMLAEGRSWSTIEQALGCSSAYIARWQSRFQQQRLGGLFAVIADGRRKSARHGWKPHPGLDLARSQ
jgi:hypothetical protein